MLILILFLIIVRIYNINMTRFCLLLSHHSFDLIYVINLLSDKYALLKYPSWDIVQNKKRIINWHLKEKIIFFQLYFIFSGYYLGLLALYYIWLKAYTSLKQREVVTSFHFISFRFTPFFLILNPFP